MFFSSSTKNNNRFRAHQKNPGKKCNLLPRSVVLKPRTQISSTSALHASCSSLAPGPSPENTAAAAAASEGEGVGVGANVCGIWRGLILTNNKGYKKKNLHAINIFHSKIKFNYIHIYIYIYNIRKFRFFIKKFNYIHFFKNNNVHI